MIRISFFVSMFLLAGCSSNGQVEVVKTPISLEQLSALCKVSTGQYPKTSSTPESIKFPEESGEAVQIRAQAPPSQLRLAIMKMSLKANL